MCRALAISSISSSLCLPWTPLICGYFSASSRNLRTVIFSRSFQSIQSSGVNGLGSFVCRKVYHRNRKDTKRSLSEPHSIDDVLEREAVSTEIVLRRHADEVVHLTARCDDGKDQVRFAAACGRCVRRFGHVGILAPNPDPLMAASDAHARIRPLQFVE